jgi:EAL domain-containing protein (putative c-di-GMP-specific phosphodiesterase class I)
MTASIGVAIATGGPESVDDLVRDADNAMYVVKRRGGNGFEVCDQALRETFDARREIEDALRDATAADELVLHYQPVIRAGTDEVAAFEALLRWQRANGTLLQPAEFITVAEETGAIVPIGAWVIEQACRRLAEWHLDGIDAPAISVNVSVLQFRNSALLHSVKRALAHTGADPGRLILEITESVLARENDQVIEQLEHARLLGMRVAIDDFGTGYSSLSTRHRLPVDIIKLDRSLVSQLTLDPSATIVCRAIIDLAHALGIEIIAEGAETAADVERLVALQCDQIQGFHYARPLPAAKAGIVARHGLRALRADGVATPTQH